MLKYTGSRQYCIKPRDQTDSDLAKLESENMKKFAVDPNYSFVTNYLAFV